MDRIDRRFHALSQEMRRLPMPDRAMPVPQTIASLIARVDAASARRVSVTD